jgi:predicted nucleotide-binding protein
MTRQPKVGVVQAKLTPEQMLDGIDRLKKRLAELQAFDVAGMQEKHPPELAALETSILRALERTFGIATTDLARYHAAGELTYSPSVFFGGGPPTPLSEYVKCTGENIRNADALLQQAIQALEEDYAEASARNSGGTAPVAASKPAPRGAPKRKVFVVHGHDDGAREAVARFLEGLGFEAIILHEQANKGRTIIEKVEAHSDVGFAVVLLTPDDEGRSKKETALRNRARQNVILELGYFVGKLGREQVCAFKRGDIEIPSDFGGVVYATFDENGGWKSALATELQAAGHDIDWNKIMKPKGGG